ncbi:MAG: hypothetical protein Q8O25_05590 [Sulfurisoma sp.]|nr:hypothetical protein [Sulfurisoma sp.]
MLTLPVVLGNLCVGGIAAANASELVQRNPFDPGRKPWKTPSARLPTLTTHDLQIEGIIAFGAFRGILAQLDGKLKGSLPANSAGKVRIAVGQTIGAGYVLERVEANHAIVLAGTERMTIPIVRKVNRGGAPSQAAIPVPAQAAMAMVTPAPQPQQAPPPDGAAPTSLSAVPPPAAVPSVAEAPPVTSMEVAPAVAAGVPAGQPTQGVPQQPGQGQPMTLLDAIKAAAEAAKNKSANPPSPSPFPFGGALAPKK